MQNFYDLIMEEGNVNLSKVKSDVEEYFKQGIFDEEFEKYKSKKIRDMEKKIAEQEETILDLRTSLSKIENRSLIERIMNK